MKKTVNINVPDGKKYILCVGIDPDVDKSGVAIWNKNTSVFEYQDTLDLTDLFDLLLSLESRLDIILRVYIESGYLIKKTSWHHSAKGKMGTAEKAAANVGANHEIGKQITKFCEKKNITHYNIPPKGKMDKCTFMRFTGLNKGYNQEIRDASMLVYALGLIGIIGLIITTINI